MTRVLAAAAVSVAVIGAATGAGGPLVFTGCAVAALIWSARCAVDDGCASGPPPGILHTATRCDSPEDRT